MTKSTNAWADSFRYFQQIVQKTGPAAGASYTLIASILIFGGLGYFADRHFDSSPLYLLIGLGVGLVVGFYEIAKVVFHKD